MYLKLFYFLRIFARTAALVRLIIETTKDMIYFLIILMLGVTAIGHWFYVFAYKENTNEITGEYFYEAFLTAYKFSFGDFTATYNFLPNFENNQEYVIIMWLMWFLTTILITVILLNLLIAIMSDTYDKITESGENALYFETIQMIVENRFLDSRKALFGD